jgi:hypothetical protein
MLWLRPGLLLDNLRMQVPFPRMSLDNFRSGTCGQQQTHKVKLLDLDPQRSADGVKHGESMRSCWKENLLGVFFAVVGEAVLMASLDSLLKMLILLILGCATRGCDFGRNLGNKNENKSVNENMNVAICVFFESVLHRRREQMQVYLPACSCLTPTPN